MNIPSKIDEVTTLSEVLAILDAIDSNESDSSISAMFERQSGFNPVAKASARQQPQLKTKKDRRRKEGPVKYSTSLQRRKKAEAKALMEEVQRLNAQLQQLKPSHSGINPSTENKVIAWRNLAMAESDERERAERSNRELKAMVTSQVKVDASLRRILKRKNLFEGMEFVFNVEGIPDRRLQPLDFSDAILAELSTSLGRLRLEADNALPVMVEGASTSCRTQNKSHEFGRTYVETTSITPLPYSMHKAAGYLWHHLTTKKNKDPQKSFRFVRTRNSNSLERNCTASLTDENNLLLNLDAVGIVRKYEEADQIILVGTTSWFLPTGGLQFEDRQWTIISPCHSNPLEASVVRCCSQLQVKSVDTSSVLPTDFAHVEKVVLNAVGEKWRNVLQLQQNVLLDKVYS